MSRRIFASLAALLCVGGLAAGLFAEGPAPKSPAAALDAVFARYFAVRTALARDTVEGVAAAASSLADAASAGAALKPAVDADLLKTYSQRLTEIALAARALAGGKFTCPMHPDVQAAEAGKCPKCGMRLTPAGKLDLTRARESFKQLSHALIAYARDVDLKSKAPRKIFLFRCSMANASWLQEADKIGNPYFGESMLKCGEAAALRDWTENAAPTNGGGGHGGHAGHGGHGSTAAEKPGVDEGGGHGGHSGGGGGCCPGGE